VSAVVPVEGELAGRSLDFSIPCRDFMLEV